MAIEHRSGLLYRITVCFNWDPQWAPLEAVRTYMLETAQCMVDTDKNTLVPNSYVPDPAIDLTREQAEKYLGTKFAAFLAGAAFADAALEALKGEHKGLLERFDAVSSQLAEASARLAAQDASPAAE